LMEKKVALVTGASRGIGKAIAIALAQRGIDIAINYRSNEKEAREVMKLVKKEGQAAMLAPADVADFQHCREMVKQVVDYFGRVDILVNNAGIRADNLLARMKEEDWEKVLHTNLNGVYNCTRSVMRSLLKQKNGGRIINIASISGIYGNAGQANYAAAKAGVIGFTKSVAKEVGARGITVNAVAPGFIQTEMTEDLSENLKQEAVRAIPLGRFGKVEEVAEVVVFLATKGSYITGQVISVDGGLVI
jgi:3-oxoacyl-[acyl-carrier protein] reductase